MQAISDKIRHYRKIFRPPAIYALGSLVLCLSLVLAVLIVGLIFIDLYLKYSADAEFLTSTDQFLLLIFEVPLLAGLVQAYMVGGVLRYRQLHPLAKRVSFRVAFRSLDSEKKAFLRSIFNHHGDLSILVKSLIDEWEWRREIKRLAQEPLWRRAVGFFNLPSASNFAAYMTGLLAVIAGIVIASMDPASIFGSFEQFMSETWKQICALWITFVPAIAICVLPVAAILSEVKNTGEFIREWFDDQYLSNAHFYRFISELLALHDRGEAITLRKTRSRVYWVIRLSMSPLQDLPRVWQGIKRVKQIARREAQKADIARVSQ